MESKRLTPTIVGKVASKRFVVVVVVVMATSRYRRVKSNMT